MLDGNVLDVGKAFLAAAETGIVKAVREALQGRHRRLVRDAKDSQGRGAVHLAAKAGHAEVIGLLHDHGVLLEACDDNGWTPLHLACEHGRAEAAMILLDRGCQADAQDALGRTPMHFAVCSKEPKLCRLLLSCPCLVTRCDARGRSALAYAVLNTMPSVRDENVQLLLEYLAEPNAQDFFGLSPLHYAAEAGAQGAVALLLQEAADPSLQEPSGRTPLDMANGEATRKLLKESARGRPGVASFGNACGYDEDFSMLGALSDANFKEMQCKFIQMMKLVQESGLRQGQHLRRPSLFDGSWMAEIHSHQKLLGKELAAVSGPHTCIRVFNLLHPPSHFPQVSLDDKDISSYYDALWDERDLGSEEKQEDLRAKQQKQAEELLEQKEALRLTKMEIQEGRTRERHLNAELQAALQDASQGAEKEARGEGWPHSLGHRVLRAGRQLAQKGEELRSAEAAAQKLQRTSHSCFAHQTASVSSNLSLIFSGPAASSRLRLFEVIPCHAIFVV
ncbi:unnamed protein product [Effrenium voratum]|nr:unnamed protein product [Effrenium voratum]